MADAEEPAPANQRVSLGCTTPCAISVHNDFNK